MAHCSVASLFSIILITVLLPQHPCRASIYNYNSKPKSSINRASPVNVHYQLPLLDPVFPNDSYVDRKAFPDNFKFGSLTWAVKHEAAVDEDGKSPNLWDVYAQKNSTTFDGTNPALGGDSYHRYKEDIKLLTDLGMDTYKFSIAWSRILPNGTGEVNKMAIDHYNDVINELLAAGVEPMVALYEQDMPQVLQDTYGGLLDPRFIDDFVYFANVCFSAFGDRIKHWVTFEEGNDFIPFAYAGTYCPPGRCSIGLPPYNCTEGDSATEPYIVGHNMLLAHASAVELYRKEYQPTQQGDIGMVIWFRWFEPLSNSSIDLEAAQRATDFTVGWFIDPVLRGDYPAVMKEIVGSRLPNFSEEESARIKGSVDFIGLNAVTAIYCTYDDEYTTNVTGYFQDWKTKLTNVKDGVPIGENDGENSVPWCMEKILNYWQQHYDNFPTYITALGYGMTSEINDFDRVNFYASYLRSLIVGIRNGANVMGLYIWSLIDGFETTLGLQLRFGLYYVDENFDRYPRLSALWFKNMLVSNSSSQTYLS